MQHQLDPWRGWRRKVGHMGSQPCLCDQAILKNLDTKARRSFLVWQYCKHIITHRCEENWVFVCMISLEEDNWKLTPGVSWIFPYVPFSVAYLNLYSLAVINHNCEHNRFSKFCVFFWWNCWTQRWSRGIPANKPCNLEIKEHQQTITLSSSCSSSKWNLESFL